MESGEVRQEGDSIKGSIAQLPWGCLVPDPTGAGRDPAWMSTEEMGWLSLSHRSSWLLLFRQSEKQCHQIKDGHSGNICKDGQQIPTLELLQGL